MIGKGSRYENARLFSTEEGSDCRFDGVRPREIATTPGVLEHMVRDGERLDLLAEYYYNDARRWWRILDANPEIQFAGDLMLNEMVGSIILIPRSKGAKR